MVNIVTKYIQFPDHFVIKKKNLEGFNHTKTNDERRQRNLQCKGTRFVLNG